LVEHLIFPETELLKYSQFCKLLGLSEVKTYAASQVSLPKEKAGASKAVTTKLLS